MLFSNNIKHFVLLHSASIFPFLITACQSCRKPLGYQHWMSCSFCERQVCADCVRQCDRCTSDFCHFCSVLKYVCFFQKLFWISSVFFRMSIIYKKKRKFSHWVRLWSHCMCKCERVSSCVYCLVLSACATFFHRKIYWSVQIYICILYKNPTIISWERFENWLWSCML